ncbi:hemolysin D [Klebsiella aerogenes]|uniref:HlyD family type I secretion periplasmic adaptor subunit n=1 Tax=Klebsiella aerogenes TaxID=548 RepID=UPI00073514C0|nr:HlyD family type I secretion periplasmic adaptor subunit [Klebsiella aerogenes]KTJ37212.1 hemolysin D [Klebsiella aerogenes]
MFFQKNCKRTHERVIGEEQKYIKMGWLILSIGLFGFLIWASIAPLDKGVASIGYVNVSGNRKTIQSSITGVISQIKVKDGDYVKEGQVLVKMNQVQELAELDSSLMQYYTSLATSNRLMAERDNLQQIEFSPYFEYAKDRMRAEQIMELQKQLFTSRRQALQSEINGIKEVIDGINFQISALQGSKKNKQLQLTSLHEQLTSMKDLVEGGFLPRNRFLEVQRQFAEVNSDIDEVTGKIGQLNKQLLESKQHIQQRYSDYQREVRTQLAQTQMDVNNFKNRLDMASNDLNKTEIISPVNGTVIGLNIFTKGGVVGVGDHLMDIVPSETPLVVDAHLKSQLIDKVYDGLPVELLFTSLNQNRTPRIPGIVSMVSADHLIDKVSGQPYYLVQVTVSPKGRFMLKKEEIKPGMPVEVFVKTGTRSLLSYLFKPVIDRAHTSLNEE